MHLPKPFLLFSLPERNRIVRSMCCILWRFIDCKALDFAQQADGSSCVEMPWATLKTLDPLCPGFSPQHYGCSGPEEPLWEAVLSACDAENHPYLPSSGVLPGASVDSLCEEEAILGPCGAECRPCLPSSGVAPRSPCGEPLWGGDCSRCLRCWVSDLCLPRCHQHPSSQQNRPYLRTAALGGGVRCAGLHFFIRSFKFLKV